jgi:hypothetical protein
MRTPLRLAVVLAVVLLTTSACALSGEGAESPPATPSPSPPGTTSPSASGPASPSASPGTSAALPDDIRTRPTVAAAIEDTAARENVTADQVVVAAWSPVTWSDGSLGCPQEGMSYTQALVEGELLILRTGSGIFQYHARTGGPFAYCANPSAGYSVGG